MSYIAAPPPTVLAAAWGDVPSWISAGATVGGLIAASIAAYFVYGQLEELREQNRLQKKASDQQGDEIARLRAVQDKQLELIALEIGDRRAAQARGVKVARLVRGWGADQGITDGYTLALTVTNDSHAPVSNVAAYYTVPAADPEPGTYAYTLTPDGGLAPTRDGAVTDDRLKQIRIPQPVALLEQGQAIMLTSHPRSEHQTKALGGIVRFTDADGRHWQISASGVLSETADRAGW